MCDVPNWCFFGNFNSVELVPEWINANNHIRELCRQNGSIVVLDVFGPNDLHTVIAEMAPLADLVRIILLVHLGWHMEQDLICWVGIVRSCFELVVVLEAPHKTFAMKNSNKLVWLLQWPNWSYIIIYWSPRKIGIIQRSPY